MSDRTDDCPACNGGKLRVYAGRDGKAVRVQYRRCDRCRATDKQCVPLQFVSRRRRKSEIDVLNNVQTSTATQRISG